MRFIVSVFGLMLVLTIDPVSVCQVDAAPSRKARSVDVRIDHEVLLESRPILEFFLDIMRGTGLSGGFAGIEDCSGLPRGELKLSQGMTLRQAMDALVAANPSYQWKLRDGVVDLIPRVGIPFLEPRINKFQVDATEHEAPAVLEEVLRLPVVQARAVELGLKRGLGQGGPGVYEEHPVKREPARIHVDLQGLALLDAFNKIAQESRNAVWIYRETDCGADKTYKVELASDY